MVLPVSVSFEVEGHRTSMLFMLTPVGFRRLRGRSNKNREAIV
jgi:hypothetical protein